MRGSLRHPPPPLLFCSRLLDRYIKTTCLFFSPPRIFASWLLAQEWRGGGEGRAGSGSIHSNHMHSNYIRLHPSITRQHGETWTWRWADLRKCINKFWCPSRHSFYLFYNFLSTVSIQYSSLVTRLLLRWEISAVRKYWKDGAQQILKGWSPANVERMESSKYWMHGVQQMLTGWS
jgi:hypothetical protein